MSIQISVVVPVFNEKETLGDCIGAVREALAARDDVEIIVVNDGSDDAPREEYDGLGDTVLHHPERRGYGAALKTGFRQAQGDIIVITDGDGTYPADRIPDLVAAVEKSADMAVGRRNLIAGENAQLSPGKLLRAFAKLSLRKVANYLAGRRIPDLNSGLRAFRRETMQRFQHLFPDGFSLTTTLTLAYLCNSLHVEYIAIDYADRRQGAPSKIRPIRDTGQIFLTIIRTILFFNPLKVCIPLALILWAAGFLALLGSWALTEQIMDGTVTVCILSGVQVLVIGLLAEVIMKKE